jgi:N-acetylneuraminic acid mutarotase
MNLPRPNLKWLRMILPLVVVIVVAVGMSIRSIDTEEVGDYDPDYDAPLATLPPTTMPSPVTSALRGDWTHVYPADGLPVARTGHSLVYDPVSDTLIMFGGVDYATDFSDVWTCDPTTGVWTLVRPEGPVPSARSAHAMVYDVTTGKVILFGGWDGTLESDETWAYDPANQTWTNLDPEGETPAGRDSHSMVYDSTSGTIVLFGGWDGYQDLGDTWVYDPVANAWTQHDPGGYAPPARSCHAMVYDPTGGRVILFGGYDEDQEFGDTWAFDPSAGTWTELHPGGGSPAARDSHSMVFDAATGTAVLFGGWDANADFGDTWAYDPAADVWTQVEPGGAAPAARGNCAMAYDSSRGRAVLFGGSASGSMMNDTWAYEPAAGTWSELDPGSTLPVARYGHSTAYDPESAQLLVFGGFTSYGDVLGDIWSFDPITESWTERDPAGSLPVARSGHRMVYDPDTGTAIMFGGYTGEFDLNDTWAYDPAADMWSDLNPAGALPPARDSHAMVYDPVSQRVLLFGGRDDEYQPLDDLWAYDPSTNSWTELAPTGDTPTARSFHAMAYDPESAKVILFGGTSYDGSETVSEGAVTATPAKTGRRAEGEFGDTWIYDPAANTWTEVEPLGEQPYPRDDHSMVYDPASGNVLLFGGWDGYDTLSDAWSYDVSTSTWTRVTASGGGPSARLSTSLAYDETSGTVMLFGGWDGYSALNDTWIFSD